MLIYYVLRPWGMLWDDVARADTGEMLYEDMMPSHYEDWYLPQLEQDGFPARKAENLDEDFSPRLDSFFLSC